MPLWVGRGQNVGLIDFCHIWTLLPSGASVLYQRTSSCFCRSGIKGQDHMLKFCNSVALFINPSYTFQKQSATIRELEAQVSLGEDEQASSQISQQEIQILQREKEKQNKEILILRRTMDEMDLRISTQKQTLAARDESMKKLLEMLQVSFFLCPWNGIQVFCPVCVCLSVGGKKLNLGHNY